MDFRKILDPILDLVLKRVSKFVIPEFRDTFWYQKSQNVGTSCSTYIRNKATVRLWISADGLILVQTILNWSPQKGLNCCCGCCHCPTPPWYSKIIKSKKTFKKLQLPLGHTLCHATPPSWNRVNWSHKSGYAMAHLAHPGTTGLTRVSVQGQARIQLFKYVKKRQLLLGCFKLEFLWGKHIWISEPLG